MINREILDKIRHVSQHMDVLNPFVYASLLIKENLVEPDKKTETAAIVLTTPTSLFLYDGVRLFIQKILLSRSDIILWTQGDPQLQRAKCDTSGLLQLGENTQGHIEIAAAHDKISVLDGLLTKERLRNKARIIFVDDKSNQLLRTYQDLINVREVEHREFPKETLYLWLRKDPKTKNIFPEGFPTVEKLAAFTQDGTTTAAASIDELPVLAQTLYLIDFDRTLLDTDKWFSTVQERIVSEICAS